ncbi:acyl-homoserine-lactone synthase [uncultured Bradyrhizobium sp.]|uniref:acyl-homoserine-lactone synthase n=1 Tax=uncultured Bradyrhizobium sp. TaxID=199684 RepID=UPI0035C9765E
MNAIEEHHFIRHKIFVEERGWRRLLHPDGREADAYDRADTIYMLAMDGSRVVGGHRLFPTVRPHMISEVFPHLVTRGPIPSAPDIFEWSRFFVVKEYRCGRTYFELLAAVQEFCLSVGIVRVTAVIEMWWLPRFQEAGFVIRPLGFPQPIENVPALAIEIEINHDSLARARSLGKIAASLTWRGIKTLPLMALAGNREQRASFYHPAAEKPDPRLYQ